MTRDWLGLLRGLHTVVVVLIVLVPNVLGLSALVQPKNNQAEFGMIEPAANGAIGERENSIDVLFVGDSEVYSTYSPLQMWHEQGFTSYDASSPGQVLAYGNTLLKRALSKQSPRVVVFETNSMFKKFSLGEGVLRSVQDVLPLFEYHNRWKSLTRVDFTSAPQATWSDGNKGFRINKGVAAADVSSYGIHTDRVVEVPRLGRIWLRLMVDYCVRHGSTPLFMSSPSPANWNMAKHNGVQRMADELGVEYVDLNLLHEDLGMDWQRDTRDSGDHLNYRGACKVSRYVGKYLSNAYSLEDRRNDVEFSSWNTAYERYVKEVRETK